VEYTVQIYRNASMNSLYYVFRISDERFMHVPYDSSNIVFQYTWSGGIFRARVLEEGGSTLWPWCWCVDPGDSVALSWGAPPGVEPETGDTLLIITLKIGMEVRVIVVNAVSDLKTMKRDLDEILVLQRALCMVLVVTITAVFSSRW